MNSKAWTPPPKLPADLPPMPMGRNGRPLVYYKIGGDIKATEPRGAATVYIPSQKAWGFQGPLRFNSSESHPEYIHFATECDSEFCREMQWGDFEPEPQKEPVKADPTKSAVERHLDQLRAEERDAEKDFKDAEKAFEDALEWRSQKLTALNDKREIIAKLEGEDDALTRRQWYEQGRKDERHHAKVRTNFPLSPC